METVKLELLASKIGSVIISERCTKYIQASEINQALLLCIRVQYTKIEQCVNQTMRTAMKLITLLDSPDKIMITNRFRRVAKRLRVTCNKVHD